jgi:hypothetical protein
VEFKYLLVPFIKFGEFYKSADRQCGFLVSFFKADFYIHLCRDVATTCAHSETSSDGQRTVQDASLHDPPTMFIGLGRISVKIVSVEVRMFVHITYWCQGEDPSGAVGVSGTVRER